MPKGIGYGKKFKSMASGKKSLKMRGSAKKSTKKAKTRDLHPGSGKMKTDHASMPSKMKAMMR